VNQILGWVSLGETLSSIFRHHRRLTTHTPWCSKTLLISTFHSIRFTISVRISGQAPKPALEDPLILPRALGLLRDTFHQCRGVVFPFVFCAVGSVG